MTLTVVIPTKNEAAHIARSICSARELGPVVVIDAGSEDSTQGIARAEGATVIEHSWEGYAAQKNWALGRPEIDGDWILFLDADEYLTEGGRAEIRSAIDGTEAAGFRIPRAYVFLGKRLRHAWWYPDYQLRLFRRGAGRFEDRRVHEHVVLEGDVRELREPLMHENQKSLSAFIDRHNRYADLEAAERISPSEGRAEGSLVGNRAERRRALKDRVWAHTPLRPVVRFLWLYLVKLGFLDGRRGYHFSSLIACYEVFIDAKEFEQRLRREKTLQ